MREVIQLTRGLTVREKKELLKLLDQGKSQKEVLEYARNKFLVDLEGLL